MKVFVSWSGEQSRQAAVLLRKYLPCIIQNLDVFVSEHDIESGARWASRIASELAESHFGILCLTPENIASPWLVFEAGALTKHMDGRACGLLLAGLTAKDVAGPLAQFQHRGFTSSDFSKVVGDLNRLLDSPLSSTQIDLVHRKWWPDIETDYKQLAAQVEQTQTPNRGTTEVLDELVDRIRGIERSLSGLGDARAIFWNQRGAVPKTSVYALVRALTERLLETERELLKAIASPKLAKDEDQVRAAIEAADPTTVQSLLARGFLSTKPDGSIRINQALAHVLAGTAKPRAQS